MVWVLKMAMRWCVYDVVRSLCYSRGYVGWGLMTEGVVHWIVFQREQTVYDIGLLLRVEFYSLGQNGQRCIYVRDDGEQILERVKLEYTRGQVCEVTLHIEGIQRNFTKKVVWSLTFII